MGLAIVTDQNFTGSPLGKVTLAETAKDYLRKYKQVIGTSDYDSALLTMFSALVANGLDKKLYALYPVLGSSLSALKTNALNPGTTDLVTGVNVSVGTNSLVFSDTVDAGTVTGYSEFTDSLMSTLTCSQHPADASYYESRMYGFLHTTTKFIEVYDKRKSGSVATVLYNIGGPSNNGRYPSDINNTNPIIHGMSVNWTTKKIGLVIQDSEIQNDDYADAYQNDDDSRFARLTSVKFNNIIGTGTDFTSTDPGSAIAASWKLYSGIIHFHAIGKLSLTENATLRGIIKTFLENVKGLSFV